MKFADREKLFLPIVAHAFASHGLPPELGAAIARQESNFAADAVVLSGGDGKRGGSYGLCQMSLKTGLSMDKTCTSGRLLDAGYNAELAARLCCINSRACKGNVEDIISMYNSGKAFYKAPDSTKLVYVPNVMKYMEEYKDRAQAATSTLVQSLPGLSGVSPVSPLGNQKKQ